MAREQRDTAKLDSSALRRQSVTPKKLSPGYLRRGVSGVDAGEITQTSGQPNHVADLSGFPPTAAVHGRYDCFTSTPAVQSLARKPL